MSGSIYKDTGSIGNFTAGSKLFGSSWSIGSQYLYKTSSNTPRSAVGWGSLGQRGLARPEFYTYVPGPTFTGGESDLLIKNRNGSFVGRLRSNARRPIIEKIEFTLDEKGCADFTLTLNRRPPFPIKPFSKIELYLFNQVDPWYGGEITDYPDVGTDEEKYVLKGFGMRQVLEKTKDNSTYTLGQDIGAIVDDIAQNIIAVKTSIEYNSGLINKLTGISNVTDIELSKHPLSKVLDTLAAMTQHTWGVNAKGQFYFIKNRTAVNRTFFEGFGVGKIDVRNNLQKVKNSIFIKRQEGKGTGGAGWVVAVGVNDLTSQAKYGIQELFYTVPGTFGDTDCTTIANNLLADLKDPEIGITIPNIPLVSTNDLFTNGVYSVASQPKEHTDVIDECENLAFWNVTGSGDLTRALSTSIFLTGAGAIKLSYTSATNDYVLLSGLGYTDTISKFTVWIRSSRIGQYITIGIGEFVYTENLKSVAFTASNTWTAFEWDVSALNIDTLNVFGIRIDDTSGIATEMYVDRVEVVTSSHKRYNLKFKRADYTLTPKQKMVKLELGELPEKFDDYVSALKSETELNSFMGEKR